MATPEKALLDIFYLGPARNQLFKYLPELERPASFDARKAFEMVARIPSLPRRTVVRDRLDAFLDDLS